MSNASPTPEPRGRIGQAIGEYTLERLIGMGAFGEVWRVRHNAFGDAAAIKLPHDRDIIDAIRREGALQRQINSPHVVRVLGASFTHEPPYIVTELIDGPSLRQHLDQEGPPPPKMARRLLLDVARGLQHAHAGGVLHRDLKPANILLDAEGHAHITDFGLGVALSAGSLKLSLDRSVNASRVVGTIDYMAPEQRRGEPTDERADIYSFGVVLFEVLTGRLPTPLELPSELVAVPSDLDEIYRRCCARLEARPRDLQAIIELLSDGPSSGSGRRKRPGSGRQNIPTALVDYRRAEQMVLDREDFEPTGEPGEWPARFLHLDTGLVFRLIKGGANAHAMVQPFLLCETPCTEEAWQRAVPAHGPGDTGRRARMPKTDVTLRDIRAFLEHSGLRLPSRAEWLWAVDDKDKTGTRHIWHRGNCYAPQPVGLLEANRFGLHDMLGNVVEWCCQPELVDGRGLPITTSEQTLFPGCGGHAELTWKNCMPWLHFPAAVGFRSKLRGFRPACSVVAGPLPARAPGWEREPPASQPALQASAEPGVFGAGCLAILIVYLAAALIAGVVRACGGH